MCIESIIITSYGSTIKNKFLRGRIFFSEVLEEGLIFPYNEGIFKQCYDNNGQYLKNIILVYNKLTCSTYINVKIIGACTFTVNGEINDCILSVPCLVNNPDNIFQLKGYKLEEIKSFITNYHKSKGDRIEFNGFIEAVVANDLYKNSVIRYRRLSEEEEKENIPEN